MRTVKLFYVSSEVDRGKQDMLKKLTGFHNVNTNTQCCSNLHQLTTKLWGYAKCGNVGLQNGTIIQGYI